MNNTNIPTKEQLQERFAQELDIEHLTKDEQEEILKELSKIIVERITMELMLLLPTEEFKKVDALVQTEQTADVQAIINKHIPDAPAIIEQVVIRALAEFKALSQKE